MSSVSAVPTKTARRFDVHAKLRLRQLVPYPSNDPMKLTVVTCAAPGASGVPTDRKPIPLVSLRYMVLLGL